MHYHIPRTVVDGGTFQDSVVSCSLTDAFFIIKMPARCQVQFHLKMPGKVSELNLGSFLATSTIIPTGIYYSEQCSLSCTVHSLLLRYP